MIGNELNRASKWFNDEDRPRRMNAYGRAIELIDLTVAAQPKQNLRRELLRLREVVGELFLDDVARPQIHRSAFRCLLQLSPGSVGQIAALGLG